MKVVRPKDLGAAASKLPLTPEEGFVLSRIDGRISTNEIVALTGLPAERVEQIVTKLESHGAVAVEAVEPPPPPPPKPMPSVPKMAAAPQGGKMWSRSSAPKPDLPDFGPGTTSLEEFAAALGMPSG